MAAAEDEELPFFVEALFPFVGTDASSLSFQRGDVIQVLNRLPSGWWDGLLDDDRGWFPSNYVRRILEAEAEEALTRREMERQHAEMQQQQLLVHQQSQNHGQSQRTHVQDQYGHHNQNAYWDDRATPAQDYWVPEVTDNGQVRSIDSMRRQSRLTIAPADV
jgi:son of sevenless-like protein